MDLPLTVMKKGRLKLRNFECRKDANRGIAEEEAIYRQATGLADSFTLIAPNESSMAASPGCPLSSDLVFSCPIWSFRTSNPKFGHRYWLSLWASLWPNSTALSEFGHSYAETWQDWTLVAVVALERAILSSTCVNSANFFWVQFGVCFQSL